MGFKVAYGFWVKIKHNLIGVNVDSFFYLLVTFSTIKLRAFLLNI